MADDHLVDFEKRFQKVHVEVHCNVTKTVTLRSGDMIWRYGVRSCRKKERQRIKGFVLVIQSVVIRVHAARVFHTSFSARSLRGH
jgi:hypothetical protein